MKGRVIDYFPFSGRSRLTLELEGTLKLDAEKPVDVTVKKYKDPRSLNANAYLWVLINAIANRLRFSKEEVYRDMLKRYGQGGAVSVKEKFAERFERSQQYNERLGESMLNGEKFVHYRFWVGSSEYNKEEFAILLDGVIAECKELDIETRPEAEIKSMLESYGG